MRYDRVGPKVTIFRTSSASREGLFRSRRLRRASSKVNVRAVRGLLLVAS
jgi:hypothetical protein